MKKLLIHLFILLFIVCSCQTKNDKIKKTDNKTNAMMENFDFELFKKYQNSNGILQLSNGYTVLSMSAPAWTIIITQGKRLTEKEFLEMIKIRRVNRAHGSRFSIKGMRIKEI